MLNLAGKVALVTGCGASGPGWGNGKAIAALFARQGAKVYGIDRSLEAAEVTRGVIESEGGMIRVQEADVTREKEVHAAVAACLEAYGRIDVLVNNVGRSEPGDLASTSEETWDEQMDVNLKSAFLLCHHVLPLMLAQGAGAVVNISSIAGLRYVGKSQVAYAAAKAALMHLTRVSAVAHAGSGVRLNCVVPGLMDTPLVRRLADKYAGGDFEAFAATRNQQVPMGRMGDSWDVAHAALFLASDEARYITGVELVVDGGLTATTK
ncbi:SDR family NAD(P)-dependent oxidoreductase [Variovorax sp. LT1R16]|uniref:SDR family NAD(P)-dependent oxidoreductase n=1 Tax=Variovorax sp. LT1R16 TaxID=3443728 RepID=UPI003F478112